jgi:hypothetical protein
VSIAAYRRPVGLVVVMTLPLLLPIVVASVDRRIVPNRVPLLQQPQHLLWAGREFTSRTDFTAFLNSRGVAYRGWAKRHPDAAAAWATGVRALDLFLAWAVGAALMFLLLFRFARGARAPRAAHEAAVAIGLLYCVAIVVWGAVR